MANKQEESEVFTIRKAVRRATPQLMAIWGPTFSGKTYSALLVAAGLALPGQKIGMIDSENGRGSAFSDDELIRKVMPQGYDVIELDPPFHPKRYIAAIRQFEREGYSIVVTDSASHAWTGEGGGLDMKERDKGWQNAKLWTKRLLAAYCYSPCHHLVCLRAQEKTKIVGSGSGQQYIALGVLPLCEKSFPFDLGLAFSVEGEVDGKAATHLATPIKWPKVMNSLFQNWKPQLLTSEIGRKIRELNDAGADSDLAIRLVKQARSTAEDGIEAYKTFFAALTKEQKKIVEPYHADNKLAAETVDRESAGRRVENLPDPIEQVLGTKMDCGGATYVVVDSDDGYRWEKVAGETVAT